MPDSDPSPADIAFLAANVGRGATVLVLGRPPVGLVTAVSAATGPLGQIVVCSTDAEPGAAVAAVRALPEVTGILSHAVDAALLLGWESDEPAALADEIRRVLAPRGLLRAVLPAQRASLLVEALRAVPFRDVRVSGAGGSWHVAARGP